MSIVLAQTKRNRPEEYDDEHFVAENSDGQFQVFYGGGSQGTEDAWCFLVDAKPTGLGDSQVIELSVSDMRALRDWLTEILQERG